MELNQFLTYCTLKGLVERKIKIDSKLTSYDVEADAHYKIQIANEKYQLDLIYAVVGNQAVIVRGYLHQSILVSGRETFHQPGVGDMVRCFCA